MRRHEPQQRGRRATQPQFPKARRKSTRRWGGFLALIFGILGIGLVYSVSNVACASDAQAPLGSLRLEMPALEITGVWKYYGNYPALARCDFGRAGLVLRAARPQRRGQDDSAAHSRWAFALSARKVRCLAKTPERPKPGSSWVSSGTASGSTKTCPRMRI